MLRVVVDTNILVSALLSRSGAPRQVVNAWRERLFLLLTCESAMDEANRVLAELSATGKYAFTPEHSAQLLALLRNDALVLPAQAKVFGSIPADPDDEKFLAIALEGGADVIVSGDKHLLELGTFRGIPIKTAREFLEMLK